jgi:uncharacterized protein YyaL (SSP411 family)
MPNRLAAETSPYLKQHEDNPVDWHPWGEEAFAEARERDVPVLLSIGYASCHWCHVMAHESFEDPETAQVMNRLFVNIKVDREERPDVDSLYMEAVVGLTGHGGWPMTVWLTPDGRPFYGGTYYPPAPRPGMPSFRQVLEAVAQTYGERRGDVEAQADRIAGALRATADRHASEAPDHDDEVGPAYVERAVAKLGTQFDQVHGGFGGAPKFPPSTALLFLLDLGEHERGKDAEYMARITLERMADGGIHDQIGGGFHRYAVDGFWLVPHFEKMLYDNAVLAQVYAHAAARTGSERYAEVARSTLAYMDRELSLPEGGFASGQDADTDGVEGITFVWTPAQIAEVLDDPNDAALVEDVWNVTPEGNFEHGTTVLSRVAPIAEAGERLGLSEAEAHARYERARAALHAARDLRPQPGRDDKALAAWNGYALAAYADAGRLLGDPELIARGERLAGFIREHLMTPEGVLIRSWRGVPGTAAGFSEDYGAVADGLLRLHAATGNLDYLLEARRLVEEAIARFHDPARGGFFLAAADGEELVARTKGVEDAPTPSGSSLLAWCLLRLARIDGRSDWEEMALRSVDAIRAVSERAPQAFGTLLSMVHQATSVPREIAIVGALDDPRTAALRAVVDGRHAPDEVVVLGDPADPRRDLIGLLQGRGLVDDAPAAYVCERMSCRTPITDPDALRAALTG